VWRTPEGGRAEGNTRAVNGADPAIVVAGDALIELVLEPDGRTRSRPGGGAVNAARTLGRLGLRPLLIARLASDCYGHALRAALRDSGVRLDGIVASDDPTTFARVEMGTDGTAGYRFYLEGTASPGLREREARALMPADAAALHVGGLGLVVDPQAGAVASLVHEAGPATIVALDLTCRPDAVRDPAGFRARLAGILRRADVLKASEADLACLEPDRLPIDAARRLLAYGPSVVLLTQGPQGATVFTAEGEARILPARARVVDRVGAGDAFGAAWLAGWLSDGRGRRELGSLEAANEAARFAAKVAALTCERVGADPPNAVRVGAEWCLAPARAGG
jgi:fructokinase